MLWGEYLCRGTASTAALPENETDSFEKLIRRLELTLQGQGLSKFSASVAVQFVTGRLQHGEQQKIKHALQYLNDLINKKSSSNRAESQNTVHRCPQLIPGLTARPFWDTATLPWVQGLESHFDEIKREFLALKEMPNRKQSSGFQHYRSPKQSSSDEMDADGAVAEPGESATDRGHWNVCYFYLHGVDFSENIARCPHTARAIDSVPRHYHHALLSALAPDTHVKPHCGPTNKKLRCHLPLCVPAPSSSPDCVTGSNGAPQSAWLRVGGEYRALQEGKCVVFDDSFEHEACNPSPTQPRVVLIVDVWHPDLSDEEVKFFDFINKAQIKAAQRLSTALSAATTEGTGSSSAGEQRGSMEREDFFHVIQSARALGIREEDISNIWAAEA